MTKSKVFQNLEETRNHPRFYLWTLRKNDSSTLINVLGNTNERYLSGYQYLPIIYRSSRPDVFCRKGVHRNLAKFTGKRLCHSLFINTKFAGMRPGTFPVHFAEFIKTPFLQDTSGGNF